MKWSALFGCIRAIFVYIFPFSAVLELFSCFSRFVGSQGICNVVSHSIRVRDTHSNSFSHNMETQPAHKIIWTWCMSAPNEHSSRLSISVPLYRLLLWLILTNDSCTTVLFTGIYLKSALINVRHLIKHNFLHGAFLSLSLFFRFSCSFPCALLLLKESLALLFTVFIWRFLVISGNEWCHSQAKQTE